MESGPLKYITTSTWPPHSPSPQEFKISASRSMLQCITKLRYSIVPVYHKVKGRCLHGFHKSLKRFPGSAYQNYRFFHFSCPTPSFWLDRTGVGPEKLYILQTLQVILKITQWLHHIGAAIIYHQLASMLINTQAPCYHLSGRVQGTI